MRFYALAQPEPQRFGKYLLLDRIAAGGMAEIYRARLDAVAGVSKQVVIKKILPHYAGNKNFVGMFVNEARIAAGLSHGNIAQIFDFGEVDGEYFLAMEFVHGQTLSRLMRRARQKGLATLPPPFALFILLELCKGLHYAHTRLDEQMRPLNIIHRDVSPQNVLISYEGEIKIVDFGIAKARVAGQTETEAGAVKGKYTYFSPEQARGKELDARTDVFATGIVLYEMLCGRLPFEGKMVDVLTRIVKGEFDRPRQVNPELAPALERMILTAMATDRTARYASAQALQEAVATALYADAPTFSAGMLAHLMTYLFEPELAAQGRPTQLPPGFLDQLAVFTKEPPPAPEPSFVEVEPGAVTAAARSGSVARRPDDDTDREEEGSASATKGDTSRQGTHTAMLTAGSRRQSGSLRTALGSSLGRLPPRWVFVGVPLLAMLLAAAVVLSVGHFSTFAIQLTSSPAGARVQVDGRPSPMSTPLLISDLSADRPHILELSAPSRRPWRKEVLPSRGRTVSVHALLESAEPPPDVAPRAQEPALPSEGHGPGLFTLSAVQHAFAVPSSHSAKVRLDAKRTYVVWAEGAISLGPGGGTLGEAIAYLDVDPPSGPAETAVVISRKPTTVRGVGTLYAFIPDDTPLDNGGSLRVRVQEKGAREALTLVLDARHNAVAFVNERRLRISELDPATRYELSFKEGAFAPRVSPAGRPVRVLSCELGRGPKKEPVIGLRVLALDSRVELSNITAVTLTIPDDVVEGNTGAVQVQLTALAPPPEPANAPRVGSP